MQKSNKSGLAVVAALFSTLFATQAPALPIGFGVNQGPMEYSEVQSDNFIIYHDARVPGEGQAAMNALERVRPAMERWFDAKRTTPLPVVMSAVTSNASFANFIADAVELQTLGQGGRDLAWHEYVHSTMYRKLDNWFGPAGALIHLPWMPAWFLEGLAESLSVSVGSDVTAGVERYQALTGDWPTYDRLHSLYSKYDFAERGYATSGALVAYLMRRGDPDKLPVMLHDFYRYSMPWWWPWAAVPFNGFMPMDQAFENFAGADGETLYSEYKAAAVNHWQQTMPGPFLLKDQGNRWAFTSVAGLASDGRSILHLSRADGPLKEVALNFDKTTGWATGFDEGAEQPEDYDSLARVNRPLVRAAVAYDEEKTTSKSRLWVERTINTLQGKSKKKEYVTERSGTVYRLADYGRGLVWFEHDLARTALCRETAPDKVSCPLTATTPKRIEPLGFRYAADDPGRATAVIYGESEEKLAGTVYKVGIFDPSSGRSRSGVITTEMRPVAASYAGDDLWVLMAERDRRTLRRYSESGECVGMLSFADHIMDMHGLNDGSLAVVLYAGQRRYVRQLAPGRYKETTCSPGRGHSSPMLVAAGNPKLTLKSAFTSSDFWTFSTPDPKAMAALTAAPAADQDIPTDVTVKRAAKAKWRGRPLFLFPWIGADDALGPQIGIVSVPLMDEMQNETVRATMLYGTASRFPYQEVAITSTRYTATVNLALFRQQTYNGRYNDGEGGVINGYLDEKGTRLETDYDTRMLGGSANMGLGIKYAYLTPYIGPTGVRRGFLAEPGANLTLVHTAGTFSFVNQLSGRIAPEQLNDNFDYNQLGFATSVGSSLPFFMSRLTLGLEGSRTRGKKMRELKEMYRPLKTFIPGSGGGYNQNSFPISGDGSSGLFAPVFGYNQARAKANFTMPLIADMDKWLWLVYLERLDFTAFYNYGAAWEATNPRRGYGKLIRAHGYNLDLQLENKGVRFNLGAGAGQVVGDDFEVYLTTGFDALF